MKLQTTTPQVTRGSVTGQATVTALTGQVTEVTEVTAPLTVPAQVRTDLPVLYTAEEAAAILRVRQGWLEKQAAARKIPFSLLGGCYRFTVWHLNEIVHIFEPEAGSTAASAPREIASRRTKSGTKATNPLRAKPRTRAA